MDKDMSIKLPAKKRLREIADRLWSAAVLEDWAGRCAVCGVGVGLEAHHLIRRSRSTRHRYTLRNGIALCHKHHKFDPHCSPHGGDVGFNDWLRQEYPDIVEWVLRHQHDRLEVTVTQKWYFDKVAELACKVDPDVAGKIVGVRLLRKLDQQ